MTVQAATEPIKFGDRYWLVRQLAVGGMAEIYLARQDAMAGFEKQVVIKRLKPALARQDHIVEMFLDEARIGAELNHPNVVHVYDVDEFDGVPYIAMEYIHGEELHVLCRRGLTLGKFLPLHHAVDLVRQTANAMGYFHARRNAAGRELDIVHCDISPTNLLVTEDGFMKVIDFGIAQAKNQRNRSTNAVPGKLSYMSPEQARKEKVDHRSDIFALGVVLYEITVGKRLFKGPANEVFKRIIEDEIEPPTFARRQYPGPLEAIVMRTLERHTADRYQSAYDLADDLQEFLHGAGKSSGPVHIARYLDELAQAGGGRRRPELISEAEMVGDDEELDFDSGMFKDYEPTADVDDSVAREWDEYDEPDEDIAAVLGVDVDALHVMRTPVPVAPSMMHRAAPELADDDPIAPPPAPPVDEDIEDASNEQPVAVSVTSGPRVAPPVIVAVQPPMWLLVGLGAIAGASLATMLYLLLA